MRKQSFLSLSVIIMLFLSACTKENLQTYSNTPDTTTDPSSEQPYSVSYSNWAEDASLTWSYGQTADPSRQSELSVPELTQEMIDAGSIVLIYARSNADGSVQVMPALHSNGNNNEVNHYSATYAAGSILLSHQVSINNSFDIPDDFNDFSFRYIIVQPNTPDPNGRPMTADSFRYMPYKGVIELFGIPE